MADANSTLVPCPFCGKHARVWQRNWEYLVECSGCYSRTPIISNKSDAEVHWNKRITAIKTLALRPCPCCGGEPRLYAPDGAPTHYHHECTSCGLRTLARQDMSEAVNLWNGSPK